MRFAGLCPRTSVVWRFSEINERGGSENVFCPPDEGVPDVKMTDLGLRLFIGLLSQVG
jgi:hypothetical protein